MPPRTRYKSTTGKGRTNVGASKSNRPGYGGSNTNSKGVNISPPSKSNNTSKSSKDISKEIDKAMSDRSDRQDQRNQQDQSLIAKFGLGDIEKSYIGDDAFKKGIPAGQHNLRSQFDRLATKYGKSFYDPETGKMSEQAKVLANYLAGVRVEKGGGLGAFDDKYGATGNVLDAFKNKLLLDNKAVEAENYRQQQLGIMGLPQGRGGPRQFNKDNFNFELARAGLSPEQYQNYIRQMIAADPREGNTFGKENFGSPFADILAKGMQFVPGIGALSRVLPKADPRESQAYGQGNKTFYDTSIPEQGGSGGIMNINNAQYIPPEVNIPLPETSEAKLVADLTPTPTGVASLTPTYASIAPQFGPQYSGYKYQGVGDPNINPDFSQYYQNLSDYYGYNV